MSENAQQTNGINLAEENAKLKKILSEHMWYSDPEEGTVCICCGVWKKYMLFGDEDIRTFHERDCELAAILGEPRKEGVS